MSISNLVALKTMTAMLSQSDQCHWVDEVSLGLYNGALAGGDQEDALSVCATDAGGVSVGHVHIICWYD